MEERCRKDKGGDLEDQATDGIFELFPGRIHMAELPFVTGVSFYIIPFVVSEARVIRQPISKCVGRTQHLIISPHMAV